MNFTKKLFLKQARFSTILLNNQKKNHIERADVERSFLFFNVYLKIKASLSFKLLVQN